MVDAPAARTHVRIRLGRNRLTNARTRSMGNRRLGRPDSNRHRKAPKARMLPLHHSPRAQRRYQRRPRRLAPVADLTVVILAAGEGTRMRSATPKVLHPLLGRPLVLWPVEAARRAGAQRIVVVDGPQRRLEAHLPQG